MFKKNDNQTNNIPADAELGERLQHLGDRISAPPELKNAAKTGIPVSPRQKHGASVHVKHFTKAVLAYSLGVCLLIGAVLVVPGLLSGSNLAGSSVHGDLTSSPDREENQVPLRRPSEEQDRLLSMERITDTHGNVDYMQPATAAKIIETASNPLYEKSLFRVSILGEEVGTEQDEYGFYFTYIQCRVEEIYSVPDNVNLAVGGTNVTLVDTRGIQDGKMWYYKGCLPTLDCYEYYVLAYLEENQDTYTVRSLAPEVVPVVDSFEQYKETMTHYGFELSDYGSMGGRESLKSCIDECKYWFENPDNLQVLKAQFADDETGRYWKTIAESERTDLVPQTLADQIIPGGSVNEIIELLGNPHSVTPYYYGGVFVYHLTEDGSQTVQVTYNYPSYTVDNIRRDYVVHPGISILETMEEETTYEEVVRLLGVPDYISYDDDPKPYLYMRYIFPNEGSAEYRLDCTQTPITATLIS